MKKRKYAKAIGYFKKSMELNSNNCLALKNWGLCIYYSKRDPYNDILFISYTSQITDCDVFAYINNLDEGKNF